MIVEYRFFLQAIYTTQFLGRAETRRPLLQSLAERVSILLS